MIETLQILNQMQSDGVIGKYAIGGAIGAAFYLEPTTSFDLDIFISFANSASNPLSPLEPIYEYLKRRGAKIEKEHIMISGWPVQFLPAEEGLLKEALAAAVQVDVRGVKTWVMSAEHLIAIAVRLGRKKDEARVERFIELKKYNPDKLQDILGRYSLVEKWKKISESNAGAAT